MEGISLQVEVKQMVPELVVHERMSKVEKQSAQKKRR